MAGPIRFYLDFASPYSWFALDRAEAIAARHGRRLDWCPIPVWALMRRQGIAFPLQNDARRGYMLADMARSARFWGVPYRQPTRLPLSALAAIRLWHSLAAEDVAAARRFGRLAFAAHFTEDADLSDPETLGALAQRVGIPPARAAAGIADPEAKAKVFAAVEQAAEDGAVGVPYLLADGEGFFGVDRLDQLAWHLAGRASPTPPQQEGPP